MLQFVPQSLWRSLPTRDWLPVRHGQCILVTDTIQPHRDRNSDNQVVEDLLWTPQTFRSVCSQNLTGGDISIRFPSPAPRGNPAWDTCVLDWHIARDRAGRFTPAPAILVLDLLQGGNRVSGYIAKVLAKNGIHGFVLHMPQTGNRRSRVEPMDWSWFLPSLTQSVADSRRCRDLIASLPLVTGPIGIQGTSLGGFIATLAASIDNAFRPVLLALTGGDLFGVLSNGKMDAARVRRHLLAAGFDDLQLRNWLWRMEPLRVAHRLDPAQTYLFSARFDQVVRPIHGRQLADAIGLPWQHRRELAGCHYTCFISAPRFLSETVTIIHRHAAASQNAARLCV